MILGVSYNMPTFKFTLNEGLEKYKLKTTPTKLGKVPATTYTWYNGDEEVAQFTCFDWWDGLNIENLLVQPKYRGQRLSYDILDYAVKTVGCKNLSVEKSNTIAKHTYDEYGFKVVDEDDTYYYMSV